MAVIHHPNLAETSLIKPRKFQPCPQKLPNGISLWASLLSVFIYISIFYFFNLSPSSLLNTTNFWFFISNTLILIIAADFGAYTSSRREQAELYEDYMIRTRANSLPTFESQYREIVKSEKVEAPQEIQEKIKEVVFVQENPPQENELQIAARKDSSMLSDGKFQERSSEFARKADDDEAREEKRHRAKCVRSKSDVAIPVTNSEENNKVILRRTESEKKRAADEEEKDEFSALSDEEVNRRVEEFIQRFNRQIRLQAAQNRIQQI